MNGLGQANAGYSSPIQKNVWPGGGRDFMSKPYHPAAERATQCVLPRFYTTSGIQRHTSWPPPFDPEMERLGCRPTGKKCGPRAPGYEGQEYDCPNMPFVGSPAWYQPRQGQSTVFGGMGSVGSTALSVAVPIALVLAVGAVAWTLGSYLWPETSDAAWRRRNGEESGRKRFRKWAQGVSLSRVRRRDVPEEFLAPYDTFCLTYWGDPANDYEDGHRDYQNALHAAIWSIPSETKRRRPLGNCPRCGGSGRIRGFSHISGGECFQCEGSGSIRSRNGEDHKEATKEHLGTAKLHLTEALAHMELM